MTVATPCTQYPDKWFSQDPQNVAECQQLCQTACPLRDECLRLALEANETGDSSGIWGGELPEDRRRLLEAHEGSVKSIAANPQAPRPQLVGAA